MNYEEAVKWVHTLPRTAPVPGLGRMRQLLAALGAPQRRLRFVHVVGTNGKGSAVVMLASVLKQSGCRVGANISPFVLEFRERFQIDGKMIPPDDLAKLLTRVRNAIEQLLLPILEFEAVTATALLYFAENACDIVCLEAGIGGGRDTTNVVENTLATCVMRVGLDHMELLGETPEEIAAEKSGVFKNHCDVISYPRQLPGVKKVVAQMAGAAGCPLTVPQAPLVQRESTGDFQNCFIYKGMEIRVPFWGYHQVLNATVVVEAALALNRHGFDISNADIQTGIGNARFPARIEVLRKFPLIVVDGAHNRDSAAVLADTLSAAGVQGLTVVLGVLKDKQVGDILSALAPFMGRVLAVEPPSPRALPAKQLATLVGHYCGQVMACPTIEEAMRDAMARPGNGILVCGSLYLAARAREWLVEYLQHENERE